MSERVDLLTLAEAARMMRELGRAAVKDKSYRRFPLGEEAGRFLRSLKWADASPNTLATYEIVLARLTIDHADLELRDFEPPLGTERVREFLDRHWGDAAPATRANRLAVLKSFFRWAVQEGRMGANPALPVKGPRRRSGERHAYSADTIQRLVSAQESLREQCALMLLAWLGLRKNELRLLQIRDIDLTRNLIVVHGKGAKTAVLPLGFQELHDALYLHVQGEERKPDEYLLYPRADRMRPMDAASVHRWFKRALARAGLPATIELHELRHTAADALWRATGNIVLAQQLLRHESVGTTQAYLHPKREDLADALRALEEARGK